MNIIDVGGIRINYSEVGTGPTIIFVHGTSQDYRIWNDQIDAFSSNYRTICYSRRCALPNQSRDYTSSSVENNTKDLEALITNLGGGPFELIGQSYGGAIAALLALKRPDLVHNLVLMEPFLPTVIADPNRKGQMLSLMLRRPSVARSGLKAMEQMKVLAQELDRKDDENALRTLIGMCQNDQYPLEKFPVGMRSIMLENIGTAREIETPRPEFTKVDAKRITQPTLLLTGEGSSKIQKGIIEELHRKIPNNQLVEIRKAAHFAHFENPTEFNATILKFLAEHH